MCLLKGGDIIAAEKDGKMAIVHALRSTTSSNATTNTTAMPGASNETGFRPSGTLPVVMGTGPDGISEIAREMLRVPDGVDREERVMMVNANTNGPPRDQNGFF